MVTAFRDSIKETGDMAGQHELVAEDLNSQVVTRIHELVKEMKEERKKVTKQLQHFADVAFCRCSILQM